jgi:spore coat protein A
VAAAAPATLQLKSYAQPLQVPSLANLANAGTPSAPYALRQISDTKLLHPSLPKTNVWRFDGSVNEGGIGNPGNAYGGYLGPTIVAQKGTPLTVSYVNGLGGKYPYWLPVDKNFGVSRDQIVTLTHLHGAFVRGEYDGNPAVDAGYIANQIQTVQYPNAQRATLLWYHDHTPGATRLGVFAGLAGAYIIRDEFDTGAATNPNKLPVGYGTGAGHYEVPLIIQDRQFSNAVVGDWLYPTTPQVAGGAGSYGMCGNGSDWYGADTPGPWIGEYFGDEMLVNGLVAPFLNVEPRVYRFRVLNACNARFLNLSFVDRQHSPPPMWQIGGDGGLFAAPVPLKNSILLAPAERADIIVDFTGRAGATILVKNTPLPKPYASPAPALGDVMQFNVGSKITDTTNNKVPPATLTGGENASLPTASTVRTITLNEWNAEMLRWYLTLTGDGAQQSGASGGSCFDDPISETPAAGAVEDWDLVNTTGDTHPIHVHLVQFQIVHRRANSTPAASVANGAGVLPQELGWKDTVAVHPGTTARIRMRFDLPGPADRLGFPSGVLSKAAADPSTTYVYHCHILEHEDNDMMRPFKVS